MEKWIFTFIFPTLGFILVELGLNILSFSFSRVTSTAVFVNLNNLSSQGGNSWTYDDNESSSCYEFEWISLFLGIFYIFNFCVFSSTCHLVDFNIFPWKYHIRLKSSSRSSRVMSKIWLKTNLFFRDMDLDKSKWKNQSCECVESAEFKEIKVVNKKFASFLNLHFFSREYDENMSTTFRI